MTKVSAILTTWTKLLKLRRQRSRARRKAVRHSIRSRVCTAELLEERMYLSGSTTEPSVFENLQITDDTQVQQQPMIAVNPLDSDHIVIAYHDESLIPGPGRFGIGISVSRDGGTTFSQSSVALPEVLDETTGASLPVVQFDADGGVHLFFDALSSEGTDLSLARFGNFAIGSGVFLARSDDGGTTWSDPTPIEFDTFTGTPVTGIVGNDFAIDRSRLLADGTQNPDFGNFYVSWEEFRPDRAGGVRFAVSQDEGVTWNIQDLETPESADFDTPQQTVLGRSRITTGPDGAIYVSSFSAGRFRVLRSTDGGTSFVTSEDRFDTRFAPFTLESTGTPQNIDPQEGGWADDRFRAEATRSIIADPTRPGTVYVADADADFIDRQAAFADIVFARSTDFGETFTEVGIAGSGVGLDLPLNDDNNGRQPDGFNEVISAQAFPSMAIDDAGNLLVVWYDTRTDPGNLGIDVFATLSTDGGQTFSPNFRITGESIDLNNGLYTNFFGQEDVNFVGRGGGIAPPVIAISAGKAFVAWTDTRGGSQDIFFAGFSVDSAPAAFNDRFEINNTPNDATDLGRVVHLPLPNLVITSGDEDWFRVQTLASGDLIAKVFFTGPALPPADAVTLELRDETGQMLTSESRDILDEAGNLIGLEVVTPAAFGETLLVQVNGENTAEGERVPYTLEIQSLTADLGSPGFTTIEEHIAVDGAALLTYTAAAAGAVDLELNSGLFDLRVFDAETFNVVATGHLGELFQSEENNDTIFTPNVLDLLGTGTMTIEGFIGDGDFADIGDSDFYSIDLQAGQQLIIDVNADSLGSPINPVIALFGLHSGPQGIFFEDGLTNDPFVVFEAPSTDAYVFAIVDDAGGPPNLFSPGTNNGAGAIGPYEIVVSTSPAVGPVQSVENNDTISSPQPLDLGEFGSVTVEGFIGDGDFADIGDKDFYSVDLQAGEQLVIHVDPATPIELATRIFGINSGVDSGFFFDDGFPDSPLAIFDVPVSDTYVFMIVDASGGFPFITQPGRDGSPGATGPYRFSVLTPHSTASIQTSVPVLQGEQLLIQVASRGSSQGDFSLDVTNRDLYSDVSPKETLIPAGRFLDRIKTADLNLDGHPDIVSVAFNSTFVEVILGNGDGTFQAPRQFPIGAALDHEPAIADVTGDGVPDIIVTNRASADVSVLTGRGDGTFETQRRFDATAAPTTVATADFNNDGILDLVVGSFSFEDETTFAILLGRGDGTFLPQQIVQRDDLQTFSFSMSAGDVNNDGFADVVDFGGRGEVVLSLGNGDGTFDSGPIIKMATAQAGEGILADLNRDGNLDLLQVEQNTGELFVRLGNGDATFGDLQKFAVGAEPGGISVADFGSPNSLPDGSIVLGPPDGKLDVIVVAIGNADGEAELVLLPGVFDFDGERNAVLLGSAIQITSAVVVPVDPAVADFNGDGFLDVAVAENRGILVRFGAPPVIPPNTTLETARDLGTVVHFVQPTRTIVPGFEDAWFQFTVPTEAVSGNDEILDFSALFAGTNGIGLRMEVLDASGIVLGRGERFRIAVAQGAELFVHVFGGEDIIGNRGTGVYTLAVDVLPQVVSVEAEPLLPGGPVNTITVVLQGDRLDPAIAEDPTNYTVTFAGPDEILGTTDDQVVSLGGSGITQPVVYNSRSNLDVSSGQTFASAIRQTVTLLFADPLPSGSYEIELSENIQTQSFSGDEFDLLANRETFGEHPVVFFDGSDITNGARLAVGNLVPVADSTGNFSVFEKGTRFLTQLQNDLSTILDSILSEIGDDPSVTGTILDQIAARILPGLGEMNDRLTEMLVIFLDPIPFGLTDPGGNRTVYDLQTNSIASNIGDAFVEVGGNVELLIVPNAIGTFTLDVANLPATPRLGALLFSSLGDQVLDLTADIRSGTDSFSFTFDQANVPLPTNSSTSSNLLNFDNSFQLGSALQAFQAASSLRTSYVLDDFLTTPQLDNNSTLRNSLRNLNEPERDLLPSQFGNLEQFREWFESTTQFLRDRLEMLRESLDKIIPGEEGEDQKENDDKTTDEEELEENKLDEALLDLFWNGLSLTLKGSPSEIDHVGETIFLPAPKKLQNTGFEAPDSISDRPDVHPNSALESKREVSHATSEQFTDSQKSAEKIITQKTQTEPGTTSSVVDKDTTNNPDKPNRFQSQLTSTAVVVALKSVAYLLKW